MLVCLFSIRFFNIIADPDTLFDREGCTHVAYLEQVYPGGDHSSPDLQVA